MAALVPITREFLKDFYSQYPPKPLAEDFLSMSEALEATASRLAALGSKDVQKLPEELKMKVPHKIDENVYRNRQNIEEIMYNSRAEVVKKYGSALTAAGVASSDVAEVEGKLTTIFTQTEECLQRTVKHQEGNVSRVTTQVEKLMPQDFRLSILRYKQQQGEIKNKAENERMIKAGVPIKDRYDALWKQQLARREMLVQLGNSTGVIRYALINVAGIPEVLLNFIKTINQDNGPMEEMRCTYAPTLYHWTTFTNRLHTLLAVMASSLSTVPFSTTDGSPCIRAALELASQAAARMRQDWFEFLTFLAFLFDNSPFFLTAEQAAKNKKDGTAAEEPFIPVKVGAGSELEVAVEVQEPGVLAWEFKCDDKDIGFGVFKVQDGKKVEVEKVQRFGAELGVVQGQVTVDEASSMVLLFDNKFSYWNKKSLQYRYFISPASSASVDGEEVSLPESAEPEAASLGDEQ